MRNVAVWFLLGILCGVTARAPVADSTSSGANGETSGAPERVLIFAFDNTSIADLQGIPTLWRFLQEGAFSTNHHTVLPTRSAPGFAAIATGRYADRSGALDNGFFVGSSRETGFTFWETMLGNGQPFGLGFPPWQPFTTAGWNVGAVGMNPLVLQTDADVRRFTSIANPDEQRPAAYRGVALYRADGTREFGAPNIPWLWPEVGAFPGWPLRQVEYPLTATAALQEHGVRVTFTYLENLHGNRQPGEYQDVLSRYDTAFSSFFARLEAAGITPQNSLFIFTTDEGDHLVSEGGRSISISAWLEENAVYAVPRQGLRVAAGAAANIYLGPDADPVRSAAALRAVPGVQAVAWRAGLRAAHLAVTDDPSRTPDFTVFADADAQFRSTGGRGITRTTAPLWNHGTLGDAMERVWLGLRGPGIRPGPLAAWTDHADILPTVLHLLGIPDAGLDGRIITEALTDEAAPPGSRHPAALRLGAAYKQLNAPVGQFSHHALTVSTRAALSADTEEGQRLDAALAALVDERDVLARSVLDLLGNRRGPLPSDPEIDAPLAAAIEALIERARLLADQGTAEAPDRKQTADAREAQPCLPAAQTRSTASSAPSPLLLVRLRLIRRPLPRWERTRAGR